MAGTQVPVLAWFQTWGNFIFAVAQIAFWVAVGYAAVHFAHSYKRLVDHKTRDKKADKSAETPTAQSNINIEEFVE